MRLGSEVYHYDAEEKVFEKASSHEERMKQKSAEKETSSEKNSILKKMDDKKKEIAGAVKDTVTPKRAVEATIQFQGQVGNHLPVFLERMEETWIISVMETKQ